MFYIIVILLAIRSSRLKMLPLHWQFVVNPLGWNLLKYAPAMSIFAAPKLSYFVEIYHKYQSQKNPVSASAMLTGKFLQIRKVFATFHYWLTLGQ